MQRVRCLVVKKSGLEKAISRLLNEKETFMMEMILLVHMKEDEKYNNLTQLIYLFDPAFYF